MPLTDIAIKSAKPKDRPYKLADEKGLYLLVNPNGGKWWRFKYRFAGKEKLLAIGVYGDKKDGVSLKKAREKRDEARGLLADGKDPSESRREVKRGKAIAAANTFEAVAREFIANQSARRDEDYLKYAVFYVLLVTSVQSERDLRTIVAGYVAVMTLFMAHSLA